MKYMHARNQILGSAWKIIYNNKTAEMANSNRTIMSKTKKMNIPCPVIHAAVTHKMFQKRHMTNPDWETFTNISHKVILKANVPIKRGVFKYVLASYLGVMQKKHIVLAASAQVYHLKCQHEWWGRTVASFLALLRFQLHVKFRWQYKFMQKLRGKIAHVRNKTNVTSCKSFFPSFYFLEKGT